MPILIEPLDTKLLRDVLDPLGLTLVIHEDSPDEWNAYMIDPSGTEYDLFGGWGIDAGETSQEALESVAYRLSNVETELGDVTIDCAGFRVEVGEIPC